jgi:hypothetical protein
MNSILFITFNFAQPYQSCLTLLHNPSHLWQTPIFKSCSSFYTSLPSPSLPSSDVRMHSRSTSPAGATSSRSGGGGDSPIVRRQLHGYFSDLRWGPAILWLMLKFAFSSVRKSSYKAIGWRMGNIALFCTILLDRDAGKMGGNGESLRGSCQGAHDDRLPPETSYKVIAHLFVARQT